MRIDEIRGTSRDPGHFLEIELISAHAIGNNEIEISLNPAERVAATLLDMYAGNPSKTIPKAVLTVERGTSGPRSTLEMGNVLVTESRLSSEGRFCLTLRMASKNVAWRRRDSASGQATGRRHYGPVLW